MIPVTSLETGQCPSATDAWSHQSKTVAAGAKMALHYFYSKKSIPLAANTIRVGLAQFSAETR